MKTNGQILQNELPELTAENEQQHHSLLEAVLNSSAHISIVSLDKNYCYTSFSHSHSLSMKKLWGVEIEKGKNLLVYIHDEVARDRVKSSIDRVLKGESFSEILGEPLSQGYYEFFWNPLVKGKKVIGASAFIQNITDRKLAEEEIKNSEDKFKDLVENISDLVCTHDIDGKILSANPAAGKLLGYEMQTLLTMRIQDILVPDQIAQYSVYIDLIQKNGHVSGKMKVHTSSGEERIWEFHNTLRITGVKNPIVRGFAKDITDRKLGEQSLLESEQLLKQGEIFARFGNWKMDLNKQMVYASEGARRIYGTEKENVTLEELRQFRLPEYNCIADQAIQRLIGENEPYDIEIKIKRESDGKVIDVHSKAKYDAITNTVFGTLQDITDRKQAAAELVKSEMLYRSILNASPDGIVITDLEGRLQLVSPAALKIFRYQHPLEVLSRKLTDFVVGDEKDRILDSIAKIFEQSKSSSGEYISLCRDGSSFPVEVNTNFIRNANGVPTNLITVIRDITQRRLAEAELAAATRQLHRTAAIAKVGGWDYNFETMKRSWSEETCRILEIESSGVPELGGVINFSFYTSGSQRIINEAVQAGIDNGTPFDLELQMITAKGKLIWVRDQGTFVQEHGRTIKVEGVIQDITERKERENEIKRQQKFTDVLLNSIPTPVFFKDTNGRYLGCNEAFSSQVGIISKDIVGKTVNDIWPDYQAAVYQTKDRELFCNPVQQVYESTITDKNAAVRDVIFVKDAFYDEAGNIAGIVGAYIDITEKKRLEAARTEAQERLMKIASRVPGVIYQFRLRPDGSSCFPFASEALTEIYRVSPDEVREDASRVFEIIHPDDLETLIESITESAKHLSVWNHEYRVKYADGRIRLMHGNAIPEREEDGSVLWNGFISDITENKKVEQELIATKLFTKDIINTIPVSVFWKDSELVYQGCNEIFAKDAGFDDPKDIIGKDDYQMGWREQADLYRSDDRQVIESGCAKLLIEEVLTTPEGKMITILTNKIPLRNAAGEITGILGTYVDITERKRIEAIERESKDRIIKIARQVPGVIYQFRLNADGSYAFPYASESLYDIFQVSPEEFYADPGSAFKKIHPDDYPDFHESILTSAKNLTPWQHECRVVLNDGSVRHMYGSSVPEPEADGSILWHGFITDTTEHKFTDERIRQLSKAVEQSPVSIVITDTTGAIQYVNPKFVELTGYSFDEAIGKNPSILKSGYTSDKEYKGLWETITSGTTWRGDLQNKKKNGELYWESATISPVFNERGETTHFLAVKEDITERVASEQKLQEGLKSYEFVNKATSDTIWEWDIKANTINRNENFTKTFGFSSAIIDNTPQWAGKNIHPDDHERVKAIIDNCIENRLEHWQAEYRYADAEGNYRYVYDRAYVLFDLEGNPHRMYGGMTDLTEKQNLKSELADQQLKQQKQLLEVNIQAHEEEKSELGKELHDNISQMLATVKMYLGLAKAGRSIPDFDIIGMSYDYVEETIAELRKLSHSLVPPSLGEIGLQEALEELVNISSIIKDISVKLVFDKKIKSCHFGKKIELMIYRIVQEQLNNIGKYAQAKNVSIILKKEKGGLQLTVTDDGVGFDMSTKGKGIGLRNMLNRVEYYSGTLQIISAPGAGCKIIVKIPFDFNKTSV